MDIKKQIIETTEYKQKQDVSLYQDVCHIIELSKQLTLLYGKGFGPRYLRSFRSFYLIVFF